MSIEKDKLEAIMVKDGLPWLLRKLLLSMERSCALELDADGSFVVKVPLPGVCTLSFRIFPSEAAVEPRASVVGVEARLCLFEGSVICIDVIVP